MIVIPVIVLSLLVSILFPILYNNNAFKFSLSELDTTYQVKISEFFKLDGFYLVLFIALFIVTLFIVYGAKNRNIKFVAVGGALVGLSYTISCFKDMLNTIDEIATTIKVGNVQLECTVGLAASPVVLLVVCSVVVISEIALLVYQLLTSK